MAIDTIKSTAVLDGAIATADIADDAVTTDKLANAINTDIAAKSPLANPAFTGKVGIGTSSPIDLTGNASPSLTISSNGPYICLQDANNANQVTYMANNSGVLQFGKVTDDGSTTKTELLRIQSGGGISFNGNTASDNALDDYEEGTWTVGWTSTNNTFNPSTTTGYYTKIGNLVTISYHAYLAGAPTINSAANGFSFTGLPFQSSSGKASTLTWGHKRWMEWPANTTDVMLDIAAASTLIGTFARTSVGELYNIRAQAFSRNGSGISFAGFYYTDA